MNTLKRSLLQKVKNLRTFLRQSQKIQQSFLHECLFGATVIATLLAGYYLVFARKFFSGIYFFLPPGDTYYHWSLRYLTLYSVKHYNTLPWWDPTIYNGYPLYYIFLSGFTQFLSPFYLPSLILFRMLTFFADVNINNYLIFERTLYVVGLNMIAIYLISKELITHKIARIFPVLLFTFSYFQLLNFHDSHVVEEMIAPLFYVFALIRYNNKRTRNNFLLFCLFSGLLIASINFGMITIAFFWTSLFTFFLVLFHRSLIPDTFRVIVKLFNTSKGIIVLILIACLLISGFVAFWLSPYYNKGHVLKYREGTVDYTSAGGFTNTPQKIETSQVWTILFNWIPFPEIHDKLLKFAWYGHDNRYIGLATLPLIFAAFLLGRENRYMYVLILTYFLCNGYIIYTRNNIVYTILTDYSEVFRNVRNMISLFPRGGPPLLLIFLAGIGLDRLLGFSYDNPIHQEGRGYIILFRNSLTALGIIGAISLFSVAIVAEWSRHTLAHIGIYLLIFSFLCKMLSLSKHQALTKRLVLVLFLFTFTDLTIAASSRFTADRYDGETPPFNDVRFAPWNSESETLFPKYEGSFHNVPRIAWAIKEWLVLATREEGQKFLPNWNPNKLRMKKYPEFQFFTNGYYVPFEKIKKLGEDQSIVEYEPLFLLHDAQLVSSKKVQPQPLNGQSEIKEYTPNKVVIKTITAQDGFLLFLDNYDRFWSASIDGKKVKIHRANFTFKAIELPAGAHVVAWVYNPYPVKIAYGVFYLVLTGFLLTYFFVNYRKDT